MPHRILVMGDNHGDVQSLRRVLEDAGDEPFDYVVHVGDFTNAWRTARQTDDERRGKERGAEQLRSVAPVLERFDELAAHGLVWVYGNQDYFGDLDEDLSVGTELPDDDVATVGELAFTNSLDHVGPETVLVTHMEHWRLVDSFDGLAHFCGNSHRGRHTGRRLNSAFLQFRDPRAEERRFGGYFVAELDGDGLDVEMRSIGELTRVECDRHGERGVQFQPESKGCMFCNEDGTLWREMCASGYYGLTHDSDRETVDDEELIEYAARLWDDPPAGFREQFESYLADLSDDRYSPLTRTNDGALTVAENSYSY
ncbi:metallophosphoesterase family protein [Halolamina sp. C58]|uniref:metallophosphoesterase family protein n=1 Tax=Halolamina sp. C58 TaxID=3421640 RepID=UPI003EBD212D